MKTAAEYRDMANEARDRMAQFYDQDSSENFASHWASNLANNELELKAQIAEDGFVAEFPALFDLEGNLLAAKLIETRYGMTWGILPSDDPKESFISWFSPSNANTDSHRVANNAKKGYYVGTVKAPAWVTMRGTGTGYSGAMSVRPMVFRTDGGFSRDVEIVDRGV